MGSFSITHWLVVLAVIVLLFGAKKIPELAKGVGKGIKSFKKEMSDDDMKNELKKIISEKKKNKTLTGTIIDEDEVNNLPDDSNEFVGEILQDEQKHTSPFTDIKESMVDALNGLNNYCKNKNIQKQ